MSVLDGREQEGLDPVAILDLPIGADEIFDMPGVITGFRIYYSTHTIYEFALYGECDIHDLAGVRDTVPNGALLVGFTMETREGQDSLIIRWAVPDALAEHQARLELAALEGVTEKSHTANVPRVLTLLPRWSVWLIAALVSTLALVGVDSIGDVSGAYNLIPWL